MNIENSDLSLFKNIRIGLKRLNHNTKTTFFAFLLVLFAFVACGKDDVRSGDGGNEVSDSGSVSDTTNGAGSYDGEIDWEW